MIHRIAAFWALLGGGVLIAIMAITSLNIAAYVADYIAETWGGNVYGTTGYEDFVALAIACAGMMFLPYCQAMRGHVVVDVFANLMGQTVQRLLDKLWLVLIFCLALFLAYWMTLGMLEVRGDNALTAILGWPVWPSYVPGIASLLLWALVTSSQIFESTPQDA
ncbi:MAG: TRAP transporter small permease [Pseudomonadota bacterium]